MVLMNGWMAFRQKPVNKRVETILSSVIPVSLSVLMTFLPEDLTPEAVEAVKKSLLHSDFRIRTGAICVLAEHEGYLETHQIVSSLEDESPNVRMAAIYAFERASQNWELLDPYLIKCFMDSNYDVRYAALRFLEAISGMKISRTPGWQPGECPYSERSWKARMQAVAHWKEWHTSNTEKI